MSDETMNTLKSLKVKASDLIRFLDATRKSTMCPHCGAEEWVLHTDSGLQKTTPTSEPQPTTKPLSDADMDNEVLVFELSIADRPVFQPAAMMHCNKCGNISLINYSILHHWINNTSKDE